MEVPQAYKTAAIVNLVSAGLSLFVSLMLLTVCWGIVPGAAAAFQAYVGWQMYQDEATPHARNAAFAGIAAGVLSCNPLPLAGSIYALLQVQEDEVKGWLETKGAAI
ncbi:MAG: hypothetical protein KTR31_24715 [Myxococcales bacterium]|nr:hypothetical protein [Myxococcales bacterium]